MVSGKKRKLKKTDFNTSMQVSLNLGNSYIIS